MIQEASQNDLQNDPECFQVLSPGLLGPQETVGSSYICTELLDQFLLEIKKMLRKSNRNFF